MRSSRRTSRTTPRTTRPASGRRRYTSSSASIWRRPSPAPEHQDHARHHVQRRQRRPSASSRRCMGGRDSARRSSRSSATSGSMRGSERRRREVHTTACPIWADRAQVRQLPLDHGSNPTPMDAFQRRTWRPTTGPTAWRAGSYIRDVDQRRRDRVQRLEHGARHGRQGDRHRPAPGRRTRS